MKYAISEIIRDYLALRGESPDLLPLLEEGEECAVLTLARELTVKLPEAAVRATLETPRLLLDDIRKVELTPTTDVEAGCGILRLPEDFLKLYSLKFADWREPVVEPEPEDSLRWALGANAPEWMYCVHRPMVKLERDETGLYFRIYGSDAFDLPAELLYIPRPTFDGETLTLSPAAFVRLLQSLKDA